MMPDSLGLVWGHSVHCAKFPVFRIFKSVSLPVFVRISSKVYVRYHNHGGNEGYCFFGYLSKIKENVENFLNTGP